MLLSSITFIFSPPYENIVWLQMKYPLSMVSWPWNPQINKDCNRDNVKNDMKHYCDIQIQVFTMYAPEFIVSEPLWSKI
jgi:hypothetical protein